jgi:hypothetical protein
MKGILMLCTVLAFGSQASGQTTYQPPPLEVPLIPTTQSKLPNSLPPVAVDWHYAEGMLNLHLANNSAKDITAYSMTISRRYSNRSTGYVDGSPTVSESMEDMLGGVIYREEGMQGQEGNGTFAAGTSKYQHIPEAADITDVNAVVDMVIFADATAYVQNERAFKQLMAIRKGQLMAMQKVDEVIKGVLSDSTVEEPIAQVLTELIALAFVPRGKLEPLGSRPEDPEGNQQIELQNAIRNLQNMQRTKANEREELTRYVEEQEKRIALMKPHCEIERTQAK